MNMWTAKGKRITVTDLLGAGFMKELGAGKFKTKQDWIDHKKDLQKMARWHSKALRDMKAGKRAKKEAITFKEMRQDKRGH